MKTRILLFFSLFVALVSCQPNNVSKESTNKVITEEITPTEAVVESKLNTDILGIKLGVTSPSDGKSILVNKGYSPDEMPSTSPSSNFLSLNNVNFGGTNWTISLFAFYNNKLMAVTFGKNCTSTEASQVFNNLASTLKEKYSECLQSETSSELKFVDGDFCIQLNKTSDFVSMLYADEALKAQLEADEKDQL